MSNATDSLALQEPPIDVNFAGTVIAFSDTEAVLQVELDASLAEYLQLLQEAPSQSQTDYFRFQLTFSPLARKSHD